MSLSGKGRRDKGVKGEREVTKLFDERGYDVRGLEGLGDQIATKGKPGALLCFHLEVKRQERLRIHEWLRQCVDETPAGMIPLLTYRRSSETWVAVMPLLDLLDLLERLE